MRTKREIMSDATGRYQYKGEEKIYNFVDLGQQLLIEVLVDMRDLLKDKKGKTIKWKLK